MAEAATAPTEATGAEVLPQVEMTSAERDFVEKGNTMYEKGYGSGPFGSREVQLFKGFVFNPVVSVLAAIGLWAFVAWCAADSDPLDEDNALQMLSEGQTWVTTTWTWLYIASQDFWLLFLFPLVYYYGDVKLGADDEKPEYSDVSYFSMVFCAGVAIGLIFFGASEPLYHYTDASNRYNNNGYYNENEKMQAALNVTIYHWGLQAWVVYAIVAITMGFLCYRKGLPLTFRTCLAPLFGKAIWGWMGDLLDVFTILTIVAGLCTSLGMGATQIVGGMKRLEMMDETMNEDETASAASWVIGVITVCATLSVACGLNYGIKTCSQIAFALGNFLLLTVFFLDEPWFILNLITQSIGYHFQNLIQLGFYTDAFAQLKNGQGKSTDGLGANGAWMDWWTIFYWGWWISWAPFVGTFLARISRGRTIKNVLAYSLGVPLMYCFVWFGTFGGAALRMHQQAKFIQKAGTEIYNDADRFLVTNTDGWRPGGAGNCYNVPAQLVCSGAACPAYTNDPTKYITQPELTPVCLFKSADADGYWFDLMMHYHGIGTFLCAVSVVTIVLYFITSSDSGSLVVDLIASNGREAHVVQRIFWALSEGAVAIVLIKTGGPTALRSLRALSIIAGLPFTFVICYMCTSLWRALAAECDANPKVNAFKMPLYAGIFDWIERVISCFKAPAPEMQQVALFFQGLFLPPLPLFKALRSMSEGGAGVVQDALMAGACGVTFFAFILLHCLKEAEGGAVGIAWTAYVAFAVIVGYVRHVVRIRHDIAGNGVEDFFAALLFFPQVLAQVAVQAEVAAAAATPPAKKEAVEDNPEATMEKPAYDI
jgi:choline-glycine betaine transporter